MSNFVNERIKYWGRFDLIGILIKLIRKPGRSLVYGGPQHSLR